MLEWRKQPVCKIRQTCNAHATKMFHSLQECIHFVVVLSSFSGNWGMRSLFLNNHTSFLEQRRILTYWLVEVSPLTWVLGGSTPGSHTNVTADVLQYIIRMIKWFCGSKLSKTLVVCNSSSGFTSALAPPRPDISAPKSLTRTFIVWCNAILPKLFRIQNSVVMIYSMVWFMYLPSTRNVERQEFENNSISFIETVQREYKVHCYRPKVSTLQCKYSH